MPSSSATGRNTIDALFVILDGVVIEENAVLQSQVGEQMLGLERAGIRTGLITTKRDAKRFDEVLGERLRAVGTTVVLLPHRGRSRNIVAMARAVRSLTSRVNVRAAYARGIWGPLVVRLAHPVSKLRYVYDIRGALADETLLAGTGMTRAKARVFGAMEKWCVRNAWRVTTVSRPFADELQRGYQRDDAVVIPSCVNILDVAAMDRAILATRAELGFSATDLVLVYSGGTARHQAIPQTLELWQRIADVPNVLFLMLTKSVPASASVSDDPLSEFPTLRPKIVLRSVPRDAVPRYLVACDAAFILRERRLMNRVASPVKFAEYLAAGLAVVASPEIGDMSSLISEERLGVQVSADDMDAAETAVRTFLAGLPRDREAIRVRARSLAAARYSWSAYASVHRTLYDVPETGKRG
jgi:glycosyltransferase involved in cell wall biosynthesis